MAVYKFNDVTGQRKAGNTLALLSSAVTQGGDIWLLQALKKAGHGEWFQVIERMELDNLLKERQIIRNTRKSMKEIKQKRLNHYYLRECC